MVIRYSEYAQRSYCVMSMPPELETPQAFTHDKMLTTSFQSLGLDSALEVCERESRRAQLQLPIPSHDLIHTGVFFFFFGIMMFFDRAMYSFSAPPQPPIANTPTG